MNVYTKIQTGMKKHERDILAWVRSSNKKGEGWDTPFNLSTVSSRAEDRLIAAGKIVVVPSTYAKTYETSGTWTLNFIQRNPNYFCNQVLNARGRQLKQFRQILTNVSTSQVDLDIEPRTVSDTKKG